MILRFLFFPSSLLLMPLLFSGCEKAPCKGDHLLLVVVDTLRPDHLSPYRYGRNTTPELKWFAEKGVLFEHCFAQATFTMASMGTMLTSTYPHHHGAGRHPSILGPENETLQEAFQKAGYRTGAFVCNPLLDEGSGFEQGFHDFENIGESVNQGAKGIVDQALLWMEEHQEEPFFLWIHLLEPHFPYIYWPGHSLRTRNSKAKEEYQDLIKRKQDGKIQMGEIFFNNPLSPAALKEAINAYDSEIAWTDFHFGRLISGLERMGLMDKTVVVFTSDHGESLQEHDLHFCHGFSVYDEALKVPLVIRLPRREFKGKRVLKPVRLLDLAPTLLSLTGVPALKKGEGLDLSGLLFGTSEARRAARPPIFSESEPKYVDGNGMQRNPKRSRIYLEGDKGKWRSVRTKKYKLIRIPREEEDEILLFDVEKDPFEKHEISREHPEKVKELLELLDQWQNSPGARESVSIPEMDEEWARRLEQIGYSP